MQKTWLRPLMLSHFIFCMMLVVERGGRALWLTEMQHHYLLGFLHTFFLFCYLVSKTVIWLRVYVLFHFNQNLHEPLWAILLSDLKLFLVWLLSAVSPPSDWCDPPPLHWTPDFIRTSCQIKTVRVTSSEPAEIQRSCSKSHSWSSVINLHFFTITSV